MTATNFRDLLDSYVRFTADDEYPGLRIAEAAEILARPVPWVDCPTCHGRGVTVTPSSVANAFFAVTAGATLARGAGVPHLTCPACNGTGKATVAQLLAWGSAVAEPIESPRFPGDDKYDDVDDYRNRILDTLP